MVILGPSSGSNVRIRKFAKGGVLRAHRHHALGMAMGLVFVEATPWVQQETKRKTGSSPVGLGKPSAWKFSGPVNRNQMGVPFFRNRKRENDISFSPFGVPLGLTILGFPSKNEKKRHPQIDPNPFTSVFGANRRSALTQLRAHPKRDMKSTWPEDPSLPGKVVDRPKTRSKLSVYHYKKLQVRELSEVSINLPSASYHCSR